MRSTFLYLLLLLLGACASEPRIAIVQDPNGQFHRYSSFGFYKPLGTDRDDATATVLSQQLMRLTRTRLEGLGYRYEAENADLKVNFYVETREVLQGRSGPSVAVGYGRYYHPYGVWSGYETEVRQRTESTLHVDVVDTARNQLVWEAVAVEWLKEHDLSFETENIASSVAQIFANFPRASVDTAR